MKSTFVFARLRLRPEVHAPFHEVGVEGRDQGQLGLALEVVLSPFLQHGLQFVVHPRLNFPFGQKFLEIRLERGRRHFEFEGLAAVVDAGVQQSDGLDHHVGILRGHKFGH